MREPFLLHLNSSKPKPYFSSKEQIKDTILLYCAKVESIIYDIYKIDTFLVGEGEYYSGAWVNQSFSFHIKANKKGHYTKNYQKDKLMGAMNEMKNKTMIERK